MFLEIKTSLFFTYFYLQKSIETYKIFTWWSFLVGYLTKNSLSMQTKQFLKIIMKMFFGYFPGVNLKKNKLKEKS